jgi:predicted N-acetyltransferase YhbS
MKINISNTTESDKEAIDDVVLNAFGDGQGHEIAGLIATLMKDETALPLLSLVANLDNHVVGHILFTTVAIKNACKPVNAMILAPLTVHSIYQNQGIGGQLIKEGLNRLQALNVDLVFVLGYPEYYSRYGFSSAGDQGLDAPYPIPSENTDAWMVLELKNGVLGEVSGRVQCADALDDPKHWIE